MIEPTLVDYLGLLIPSTGRTRTQLRPDDLSDAIEAFEVLRAIEIQNYFRDECVDEYRRRAQNVVGRFTHGSGQSAGYSRGLALIYSMVLADRMIFIYRLNDGPHHVHVVDVDRKVVQHKVMEFRRLLQMRMKTEKDRIQQRATARELYRLLLSDLEGRLLSSTKNIETLVFIPDGILGLMPFSALVDERGQYLGERAAIAIIPGRNLVDLQHLDMPLESALIAGKKNVPGVAEELREVAKLMKRNTRLVDGSFTRAKLDQALGTKPYDVVHIASHAYFGDDPRDIYIETAGSALDLNDMEKLIKPRRFRDPSQAIDLMTLSACKTAEGSERAALGLAP